MNLEDGSSFDREWRANAEASAITQARQQSRTVGSALGGPAVTGMLGMGGMGGMGFGGPPVLSGPGYASAMAPPARPQQSDEDRRAAREANKAYERQRDQLIADARRQREGAAVPSSRGGRAAAVPALGMAAVERGGAGRPPSSHRGSLRTSGGRGSDAEMASRLAQQEARRAGLY